MCRAPGNRPGPDSFHGIQLLGAEGERHHPLPRLLPPARVRPARPRAGSAQARCAGPPGVSVERTAPTSFSPMGDAASVERLRLPATAVRGARGWCAPGSAAGRPSPARYSSPSCTKPRRSRRIALPAAASARRSPRRAWASREAAARRAGRSRRRHAPRRRSSRATSGSTAGAMPTSSATNGADLRRERHGYGAQVAADRDHPPGRLRRPIPDLAST